MVGSISRETKDYFQMLICATQHFSFKLRLRKPVYAFGMKVYTPYEIVEERDNVENEWYSS